ncbi:PREDICTED: protein kinase APK1B, chloroplastic-like [Ipomoea nil]|uniref:protein kinase APK1B, chloroplastic-like n=1 Tax=Ipomoea nil TaxID=35883 RepID=UPI00090121EE|nr:PREDICTED: protein kinase APK1B, chloroplastic-like [Ipomoea nil]
MAYSQASSPLQSESRQGSVFSKKYIWGGVIVAISMLFFVGSMLCCFRKKLYANCSSRRKQKGALKAEELMLRIFQLEEILKATNNFSKDCLLGSGAFGNVYQGMFDGEILAIKKAHSESYMSTEEFINEVRLLARVKHGNLVGLVGFCEEAGPKGSKILVYEYVPNGSLLDYIMGRGGKSLKWRQRVNIAIGAAKGIAHLHQGIKPGIIHRDIKPSNILIGESFEAKVSDFGLVISGPSGDQSHVSSQIKGTPGYLDPAYCSTLHLTPFTDVFSFGVILLQLVAARPVILSTKAHPNHHIIDWARPSLEQGRVEDIVDVNLLLEPCNMEMMLKMGQLGLKCVVQDPKQRPTMTQVWQELEAALYLVDNNVVHKQPSDHLCRPTSRSSQLPEIWNQDSTQLSSQNSISIDAIQLQKFYIEMDSLSHFPTENLGWLENKSADADDYDSQNLKETIIAVEDYNMHR